MGTGNWRRPRSRPDYSHRALQLLTWERLTDGDLTACRWQDGVLVQGAPTRQECAAHQNARGLPGRPSHLVNEGAAGPMHYIKKWGAELIRKAPATDESGMSKRCFRAANHIRGGQSAIAYCCWVCESGSES